MSVRQLCVPAEHRISRRSLLGGMLAAAAGSATIGPSLLAAEAARTGRQLLVISHHGGLSQLESWDPKPGTRYAGPCRRIATSVPGIEISEWMPHTATQMQHLTVVRSLSTGENNHGPGQQLMFTGRRMGAGLDCPSLECVANRKLTPPDHPVPGYVGVDRSSSPAFLGPQFGAVSVKPDEPPGNLDRLTTLSAEADQRRNALRQSLDSGFFGRRGTAETRAYAATYEQAGRLMQNRDLFRIDDEPARDHQRYGSHEFGQKCLMARRLLERGVTCVSVGHHGYDTHAENFNVHLDLLEQFDRPFACLIEDLASRGLLEHTLVVAMGEFGRTPNINHRFGRDHWSGSWSAAFAGARMPAGIVYGKTSDDGSEVVDGKIDAPQLFHTMCQAIDIDSTESWTVQGQSVPIGDPAAGPVTELLT